MKRFAIYYMPEPGPLANFAACWLGWNATTGESAAQPDLPGLPLPLAQITATPRKYGFHGTIKPPFRLAAGQTAGALHRAAAALAARAAPIVLDGLHLHRLGGFLALTARGDQTPLAALAGSMVMGLDLFRAPPTEAEIARRSPEKLTPRQRDLLGQWGYPYVMDQFQFHLTLSGNLPHPMGEEVARILEPLLTPLLPQPFVIRDLCLCGEDDQGMFHLLHRYPLGDKGGA